MLRSILAVVVGFLVVGLLAVGADVALMAVIPGAFDAHGRVESPAVLAIMQIYVFTFAALGCFLAGVIARRRPMLHALVLGVAGLVFNIAGTVARWNEAPAWYHVVALLLVMPAAWVGGLLAERWSHRAAAATEAI